MSNTSFLHLSIAEAAKKGNAGWETCQKETNRRLRNNCFSKEISRSNPDGLQGKATQSGGKKTGQAAYNSCEYRFSFSPCLPQLGKTFRNVMRIRTKPPKNQKRKCKLGLD
ncbi:MAG: hypothetical protein HFF80_05065 [Oscillospiraceae bacterium]|nr:hypothetical protein [Oscillospiraceae bacterium]